MPTNKERLFSFGKGKEMLKKSKKSKKISETDLCSDNHDLTKITLKPDTNVIPVENYPALPDVFVNNNNESVEVDDNIEFKMQLIESKKLHDEHHQMLCKSMSELNTNLKSTVDSFKVRLEQMEVDKSLIVLQNENLKQKINLMYICMIIITILEAFVVACFAVMR
jgi:hypothetical protein